MKTPKRAYEVVINLSENSWKSLVMLTDEQAQRLRDRLLSKENEGMLRKDAWHVYSDSSPHMFTDVVNFLDANLRETK